MTVGVIYPSFLPDFMVGKVRSQQQDFIERRPLQGVSRVIPVTRDSSAVWEVQITCHGAEAALFQDFLMSVKGGRPFVKKILTEFGKQDYVVTFLEEPRAPEQLSDRTFRYSAVIHAVELDERANTILFYDRSLG